MDRWRISATSDRPSPAGSAMGSVRPFNAPRRSLRALVLLRRTVLASAIGKRHMRYADAGPPMSALEPTPVPNPHIWALPPVARICHKDRSRRVKDACSIIRIDGPYFNPAPKGMEMAEMCSVVFARPTEAPSPATISRSRRM